jgi:hypothetical protein
LIFVNYLDYFDIYREQIVMGARREHLGSSDERFEPKFPDE